MHSDVFPRADLAAILRAIALTAAAAGGNSPHDLAFQRGFAAAIAAVATAVHIIPVELGSGRRGPDSWAENGGLAS